MALYAAAARVSKRERWRCSVGRVALICGRQLGEGGAMGVGVGVELGALRSPSPSRDASGRRKGKVFPG
jgi:hypothetical protein